MTDGPGQSIGQVPQAVPKLTPITDAKLTPTFLIVTAQMDDRIFESW